jgi:opacity protein-like surface antigen
MKRFAFLAAFAFALVATPAAAQISVYGGGGVASPQGDDLENVDAGLILVGGVTFDLSEMLSLYAEGAWGTHDSEGDVTVNPSSLMAGLLYGFGGEDAAISPYVFAGAGLQGVALDVTTDPSDRTFGWQAGAGLGFELVGLPAFLEGRYHSASFDADSDVGELDFGLLSFILGFSFDLSGDN